MNWGPRRPPDEGVAGGMWPQALGCLPEELFFTSCGTEGDNWAIQSALEVNRRRGKHIITTAIEHAAVLEPCRELERRGYEVTYLEPDRQGNITAARWRRRCGRTRRWFP